MLNPQPSAITAAIIECCNYLTVCCYPWLRPAHQESFDIERGESLSEYISLADDPVEQWFESTATRRATIATSTPSYNILRINQQ